MRQAAVLAEQVPLLILVAGGYKPLESQVFEVVGKVVEEVRHAGVIAVAENSLSLEVFLVMFQLILDIRELGVEFILLGLVGTMQITIVGHGQTSLGVLP